MKKKDYIKLGGLMLLSVCLLAGNVSGTYAKYTSEQTASDTIRLAKWSFNVNDNNIVKQAFSFNILDGKEFVAPGDSGSFTLKLENTSEVDAKYSVDFEVENNASSPVHFSRDGKKWFEQISDLEDVEIAAGASEDVTVLWQWETISDADDTNHGSNTEVETIKVDAKVTATQALA